MTIFARNNRKSKVEEPQYISSRQLPDVPSARVQNQTNKSLTSYDASQAIQSNEQEKSPEKKKSNSDKKKKTLEMNEKGSDQNDKATDKIEKVPAYRIVCLPLDTRSGRVLLVSKSDNSGDWVLVSDKSTTRHYITLHAMQ
jgi:hypothetical protein